MQKFTDQVELVYYFNLKSITAKYPSRKDHNTILKPVIHPALRGNIDPSPPRFSKECLSENGG